MRIRQDPSYCCNGVVIEFVVVVHGSVPIENVRLIPNFPFPVRDLNCSVAILQMSNPVVDEIGPLLIVIWWIGPARVEVLWPTVPVWHGMRRKSFLHKPDLNEGRYARRLIRIKDLVDDAPVINWPSGRVTSEGIRRTPLQCCRAVARGQQVVGAVVHRMRTELRK